MLIGVGICLLVAWPLIAGGETRQEQEIPEMIEIETGLGTVTFPHLEHIEDYETECVECHHEVNASELKMPHEDYFDDFWIDCEICHVPDGAKPGKENPERENPEGRNPAGRNPEGKHAAKKVQKCSQCHKRSVDDLADETLSAKVVVHKSCWSCHETGTGSEASEVCAECHEPLAPETPSVRETE